MIIHEFDLSPLPETGTGEVPQPDGQGARHPGRSGQSRTPGALGTPDPGGTTVSRWITLLALGLLGVAAGAVLAAAPSGPPPPPPLSATLTVRDVLPDSQTPVIVLRLIVQSPDGIAPAVTRLLLDGAGPEELSLPLLDPLTTGGQTLADVRLRPVCSQAGQGGQVHARVVTPSAPKGEPVVLGGPLGGLTGVCGLADSVLPEGWRTAIAAQAPRTEGANLIMTVPGLAGLAVSGAPPVKGVQQVSAQVGDRLLAATLTNGTILEITGPPDCSRSTSAAGVTAVPTTVRLLVRRVSGLEQVVITAGPGLASWLVRTCPDFS